MEDDDEPIPDKKRKKQSKKTDPDDKADKDKSRKEGGDRDKAKERKEDSKKSKKPLRDPDADESVKDKQVKSIKHNNLIVDTAGNKSEESKTGTEVAVANNESVGNWFTNLFMVCGTGGGGCCGGKAQEKV